MLRLLLLITYTALITACSSPPKIETGDDAEVVMGSLHRVDNARAQFAFIDPRIDLHASDNVMLAPLDLSAVEIIQPDRTAGTSGDSTFVLTDADKASLRNLWIEGFGGSVQNRDGLSVVDESGGSVLLVSAALTGIAPTASQDNSRSRPTGRSRVYTEGAGSIAIAILISDSVTGEIIGLIKDARASSSFWGVNNSVTNAAEVRRMFSTWGNQFRSGVRAMQDAQATQN